MLLIPLILSICSSFTGIRGQCFYTGTCYTAYDRGISYRGHVSVTRNGSRCISWGHHLHVYTPDRFLYEGLERNYCRNPLGKREAPWCYTAPSGNEEDSWELCNVPLCDKCLFRGVQMKLGDRFHDGCSMCICQNEGIKCLECPGPAFTTEIGCYVKFNQKASFPKCCSKVVCHGKDPDFVMDEYFSYLQLILRTHQQSVGASLTTSTHINTNAAMNYTSNASRRIILP